MKENILRSVRWHPHPIDLQFTSTRILSYVRRLFPPRRAALSLIFTFSLRRQMTDLDFDISCSSMMDTECVFEVRPMMNTFEEFCCGLTADSHPAFKMTSQFEGTMGRRGGEPIEVVVKCEPNGATGDLIGYVAFILPEEKAFSTFYKITCHSQ